MAKPLSWTRKITGRHSRHAAFTASQNSPSLEAPSPMLVSVTASDAGSKYRFACAQPTAGSNCVLVADDGDTMCSFTELQCEGIWRPPDDGSDSAPTDCSSISSAVTP